MSEAITVPAGDKGSEFTPRYTLQDVVTGNSFVFLLLTDCFFLQSSQEAFLLCKIGDSCLFWKHGSSSKV